MGEVETIKIETRNAISEVVKIVQTCMDKILIDNTEKCKALGNTVVKIHDKVEQIIKKFKQLENKTTEKEAKPQKSFAKLAAKTIPKNTTPSSPLGSPVPTPSPSPPPASLNPTVSTPVPSTNIVTQLKWKHCLSHVFSDLDH